MKFIMSVVLVVAMSGCSVFQTGYERKKEGLERDIIMLKLEVRKARLENQLGKLEE